MVTSLLVTTIAWATAPVRAVLSEMARFMQSKTYHIVKGLSFQLFVSAYKFFHSYQEWVPVEHSDLRWNFLPHNIHRLFLLSRCHSLTSFMSTFWSMNNTDSLHQGIQLTHEYFFPFLVSDLLLVPPWMITLWVGIFHQFQDTMGKHFKILWHLAHNCSLWSPFVLPKSNLSTSFAANSSKVSDSESFKSSTALIC